MVNCLNSLTHAHNTHTHTHTHTRTHTHTQCSVEMQQILRLALRDGDEWVRLFATILAPFPHSQSIDVEPCTEGNMEGVQTEVAEACTYVLYTYTYISLTMLPFCTESEKIVY